MTTVQITITQDGDVVQQELVVLDGNFLEHETNFGLSPLILQDDEAGDAYLTGWRFTPYISYHIGD